MMMVTEYREDDASDAKHRKDEDNCGDDDDDDDEQPLEPEQKLIEPKLLTPK